MAKVTRNFSAGRMNKLVDERLVPDGEYIDALNIRMGSTEGSEVGTVTNVKGTKKLTNIRHLGSNLSLQAECIGAIEDSANETIYWLIHDPTNASSPTGKLDIIVAYNVSTTVLTYLAISVRKQGTSGTTLNFNPKYRVTGINIIDNLLFFTDDYNPPRFIDRKVGLPAPVFGTDAFSEESLLVIKKPPSQSPGVRLINTGGQDKFLDERFICFAYRYRYKNGEYSAISQFSAPAFEPRQFQFDVSSFLNEGMTNLYNAAVITYNTGGPLVVGIDLLFKETHNNIIKVIEKLDKKAMGLPDNANQQYTFTNSKIFTVLPESELLRLYDNVPLLAKAQTIMGNRIMYGNYTEGYDMVSQDGVPVKLEYEAKLVSDLVGNEDLADSTGSGTYDFGTFKNIANATVFFDLTGADLIAGSSVNFEIRFSHSEFFGNSTLPTQKTQNIEITFTYSLIRDYSSVYEFASSIEFQEAIGVSSNISTVANSCTGTTFTDQFNCAIPATLGIYQKHESGIMAQGQPIKIITSPSSKSIGLQLPAMFFVDNPSSHTHFVYEYYQIVFAEGFYQKIDSPKSLHSNRGYEVGIVYMDDFGRSTTALVSPRNTVHIPCSASDTKNSIHVTIPHYQYPPVWAKRYKFVIKPDRERYETIYSNIFFTDPATNNTYFLLEGENAKKVEVGDRLIVKSDTEGPTNTCVYTTVLEKEAKQENFISIPSVINAGQDVPIPSGVYMKLFANNFFTEKDELAVIAPGRYEVIERSWGYYPRLAYPMNIKDEATGNYVDYTVPAGSIIRISFAFSRPGPRSGDGECEKRNYQYQKTFVSSADYDNMKDWWDGDNVASTLNDGVQDIGGGQCEADNIYISTMASSPSDIPTALCNNYYRFYRDPTSSALFLLITGTRRCPGLGTARNSSIYANIEIFRAESTFVFETEPQNALPDVFYENDLSFPIIDGFHEGNIQNQSETTPAIVDTKFFNCFCFGNGVESYKIRDSVVGYPFSLGNRVTSVSAQDYKRVRRFADITYSGVYNFETNVNKLNEFNLGLLNYKYLEVMFGPIYVLDGRQTDVLVLQEDKVSYVLAGKNLLSDAAAGGAITSVPEVLGTQIARVEKYGISFNPESYVQWGPYRFFTDVKRGAVIQIIGDGASSDKLNVISEAGMRTWFRDAFSSNLNTQKIGGFDPYSNEYVISSNVKELPPQPQSVTSFECGVSQSFNVAEDESYSFVVDFGQKIGDVDVSYAVSSEGEFQVNVTYDGNIYTTGVVSTSGVISFEKSSNLVTQATIEIVSVGSPVEITVTPSCPISSELILILVTLTSVSDQGKFIHNEYRYVDGEYVSPLQSNFITFEDGDKSPVVSQFDVITGSVGTGGFPPASAVMTMISNRYEIDTFTFDPATDKLRFVRTNSVYNNNADDIESLLSVSTPITASVLGDVASGTFAVPGSGNRLYMIWDYRKSVEKRLCHSSISQVDACCNCGGLRMIAEPGIFNMTGSDAALIALRKITADGGSFLMTGGPANFSKAYRLIADTGNFALTGQNAGLVKSLKADVGSFQLSGGNANIAKSFSASLCHSTISTFDACCGCAS